MEASRVVLCAPDDVGVDVLKPGEFSLHHIRLAHRSGPRSEVHHARALATHRERPRPDGLLHALLLAGVRAGVIDFLCASPRTGGSAHRRTRLVKPQRLVLYL